MTQSNKINFENILLDNYDVPIDITFSPPSQSKNNSDVAISNRSSPSNSHIRKIEDYINKKFHQTALDHLKKQIITEVTEEVKHCNKPVDLSGTIPLLKSQIQSLESEVQFLREELKEKMFLVKSLVTAHVTLSEALVNKNYKEINSTAESYNKITKKILHHLLMIL